MNLTRQRVAGGGCLYLRRCCVVRRFTLTNGYKSCVETPSLRLVIDTMLHPIVYCSCASSSVHISGPHWTMNSSTCVKRRLYLTFRGSVHAKTVRMDAFPHRALLPRRGSMVGAVLLLEAGSLLGPFFLLGLERKTMRVPSLYVGWEVVGGM